MSDSDSSEAPPPTYRERLVENLSKRITTARFSDLISPDILQNRFLRETYYRYVTGSEQPPSEQARVLVITFVAIIKSIAKTGGIDKALLDLTGALVAGASRHVATSFDGYFLLLRACNLRLYEANPITLTPVANGKIFARRTYVLKNMDPQARPPVTATPPDSGRIEIKPLVQFWYDLTFIMQDGEFIIGNFVNNLCGAAGMSILEDEGGVTTRIPPNRNGGALNRPLPIERRVITSAAGLPPLHLLSIRSMGSAAARKKFV